MNKKLLCEIGKERIYNKNFKDSDKEIILWEVLDINENQGLLFRFIDTHSKYKQGVRLAVDAGEGYIEINGKRAKGVQLWEDTCPKEVRMQCDSSEGKLSVYNIFDLGSERGGIKSQVPSCGMIKEQKENIYRYYCNDAGFQTNFDKLVFEIELI